MTAAYDASRIARRRFDSREQVAAAISEYLGGKVRALALAPSSWKDARSWRSRNDNVYGYTLRGHAQRLLGGSLGGAQRDDILRELPTWQEGSWNVTPREWRTRKL